MIVVAGSLISVGVGISLAYSSFDVGVTPIEEEDDVDTREEEISEIKLQESCEQTETMQTDSGGNSESNDASDTFTIGNTIGVERVPRITVLGVSDPEEKISFRFTSRHTGEVRSAAINILESNTNWTGFHVGLQEDDGSGRPNGEWITTPGIGNTLTDTNRFITIDFGSPAPLLKERVYHLVIEPTERPTDGSGGLGVKVYNINAPFQPFNEDTPEILWRDDMMSTLYFDGANWQETDNWPIFVVKYDDGSAVGQPYSLAAQWVTFGARSFGQELIPTSDYVVEKFGFSVAARGNPADNLCYEVRDSDNRILATGFFSGPEGLQMGPRFTEAILDPPLKLEHNKLYRFVLFSPKTTLEEPYHIMGHEYVYDRNIGYGGLRNILTASYDSGSTWHRWEDADLIFSINVR